MKKYPTSKEILDACNGDKSEACKITIQNIIEIFKNLEDNIDNLPSDLDKIFNKLELLLDEIIKSEKDKVNDKEFNGLSCPLCGGDLYDSNPDVLLYSYPAQKNVSCSKCNYNGYRIVGENRLK